MSDTEWLTPGSIGAVGLALLGFGRWVATLWQADRKEERIDRKEERAAARAESERMVGALLEQARSNAILTSKLDAIGTQVFETTSGIHDTPNLTDSQRGVGRRVRTAPMGYPVSSRESQGIRIPRRGSHHDGED